MPPVPAVCGCGHPACMGIDPFSCYPPQYCLNCGVEYFPPRRQKYCSPRCRVLHFRNKRCLRKHDKSCDRCGERFTPPRSDARYCSSACRQAEYRERKAVPATRTINRADELPF